MAVRGGGERAERKPWPPWNTPGIICGTNWLARLSLRHVPELHFEPDRNPDADSRIDFLLKTGEKIAWPHRKLALKSNKLW